MGPSTPPQEGTQDAAPSGPADDSAATPPEASDSVDRLLSLLYFSQVLLLCSCCFALLLFCSLLPRNALHSHKTRD